MALPFFSTTKLSSRFLIRASRPLLLHSGRATKKKPVPVTAGIASSMPLACDSYQGTPSKGVPKLSLTEKALAAAMAVPIRNSDPGTFISTGRTFFVTSSIAGKRNLLRSDRSDYLSEHSTNIAHKENSDFMSSLSCPTTFTF